MRNKVAKQIRKVCKQTYGDNWKKMYKAHKQGYLKYRREG